MNIVVDINHPAHVHYFKNFIKIMVSHGNKIMITASKKDVSYSLLNNYGFSFIKLGTYGDTLLKKLVNIPVLDYRMLQAVKQFNPDLFIGFGSIRAAHVSSILNKPCISLDDSEPTPQEHLLYVPFSDVIITPTTFRKNFGTKHVRYNGFIELAYLHPKYFSPNYSILNKYGIKKDVPYSVVRFVSWEASHDFGKSGILNKERLINELKKYGAVFISSEKKLNPSLEPYRLKINPEDIHDILFYANLFVGDGQTMSTEASLLGVPTIRCNSFVGLNDMGNFIELEKKYGLMYNYNDLTDVLNKVTYLYDQNDTKSVWQFKRRKLLDEKIDVTNYLVNFVEKYFSLNKPK